MRSRLSAGAGTAWVPALLVCLGTVAGAAGPVSYGRFPQEASGEISFQVDGAILISAAGKPEVFLYIGIPQDEVVCLPIEGRGRDWASLRARLSFLDSAATELANMESALEVPCGAGEREAVFRRRVVRLRAPFIDGTSAFVVRLEDRNKMQQGLINQIQGRHAMGLAGGTLPLPQEAAGHGLGGPVFLWDLESDVGLREEQGHLLAEAGVLRELLDPNPARTYGVFKTELVAYLEVYAPSGASLDLRLDVHGMPDSVSLVSAESALPLPWERTGIVRRLDIARLPAGTYRLAWNAEVHRADGQRHELAAAGRFQVQWDPDQWRMSRSERADEATLVLDGAQWRRYCRLPPGRQEAFLDSLWAVFEARRGESTGRLRALFRQRVAEADERFGALGRSGSLTDRGRIYVRFGEPDEIHKELNPQNEDLLFYFLQREISDDMGAAGGGRPKRHPMDVSAYQAWYYVHHGDPLLGPQSVQSAGGRSLRFIFVDEMGTGDYRMIYSNLLGGYE